MSCLNFRGYKRTATGLPLNLIASMFLSKLTISGNTEQRNLPEGYTQVEYLQSTGTQWIVTDITSDQDTGIYLEAAFDEVMPVGSSDNSGNIFIGYINNNFAIGEVLSSGNFYFWRKNGTGATDNGNTGIPADTAKHTFKNNYLNDGLFVIDDTEKTAPEATFANNYGMAIFRTTYNSATSYYNTPCKAKIYRIKISQGAEVVHDIFPCTRDTDSKPGMYDTMTDTFMTNAGTGEFMAGAEVAEPTPDNPIDVQLCGDRTANLFDEQWRQGNLYSDENVHDTRISSTFTMPIKSGETYSAKVFESGYRISLSINQYSTPTWGGVIVDTDWQNDFATIAGTADGYIHISLSRQNETALSYTEAPKVMLAKGLYTAETMPDYEPYGYKVSGRVEGVNLFDGVWRQGLSWSTSNASTRLCNTQEIAVKKGETYTIISYANNFRIGIGVSTVFPCTNASTIVDETEWQSDVSTITASVDGYLLTTMRYADNSNISPDNATDTMLLKGSYTADTIPPYEPYQPPQDFAVYLPQQIGKVDSAVDKIVLDMENKTAELTRQYRRYDFTGTESWTIEYATGYGDDGKRFAMVAGVPYSGRKKTPNNRFSTTTDNVHINNIMFSSAYNIYLYMSACSTVDELKTYLQNNPTYAYIPYSTPQTTDITALQDWDAMPDVKGTVTLTLSAEVEPSGVEAVYYSKERSTE